MKTGKVVKDFDLTVTDSDLELINKYTKKELSKDQVYTFCVVLCDNDVDRDFERFTVESLFELEKLFVGKTGIFDHNPSAVSQSARIYKCYVEAIDGKKTTTGDDYFRLVCKAYMPISEDSKELITKIDSGIIKEVSVGCAVKHTLCSICSHDIYSAQCHHTKGHTYNNKLCFGELSDVYDAYEFSFVAVPAQKNAGVIKAFINTQKENVNMKEILSAIKKGKEFTLSENDCEALSDYIAELKQLSLDGKIYREQLEDDVCKSMCISHSTLQTDVIKGIVSKMSVKELKSMSESYSQHSQDKTELQLFDNSKLNKTEKSKQKNQFTI